MHDKCELSDFASADLGHLRKVLEERMKKEKGGLEGAADGS